MSEQNSQFNNQNTDPDDADIAYAQELRKKIIAANLGKDGEITDNVESQEMIRKTLSDMDKSILTRKRIKSDESNADKQREMARAIIVEAMRKRDLRIVNATPIVGAVIPTLPELPDVAGPAPGETSVENSQLTYEPFMRENAPEIFQDK